MRLFTSGHFKIINPCMLNSKTIEKKPSVIRRGQFVRFIYIVMF